jgi:hypothetical protein
MSSNRPDNSAANLPPKRARCSICYDVFNLSRKGKYPVHYLLLNRVCPGSECKAKEAEIITHEFKVRK